MDFFEHQEQARRKTGMLVVLFVLAVVCTVVCVNVIAVIALGGKGAQMPAVIGVTTLAVLGVIGVGSLVKAAQMSGGGIAVAEALGGVPLRPDTRNADERRVLNVVEEMAIASGLPVLPVYILDDDSINAFAAGRTHRDSVIGLTRGCVRRLDRDELQGVIAHEFSHIFHRDTTLNIRLVAWLGGIFALALIGEAIMRGTRHSTSRKNGGGIVLFALGLWIIGSIGYFFGRLIQSAVCRQREFLADASAVQYTRNPEGLAGALVKIMRGAGSTVSAPRATEFSHFFFANGLSSLFATHPPPEERIRRIRDLKIAPAAAVGAFGTTDAAGALPGTGHSARIAPAAAGLASAAALGGAAEPQRMPEEPLVPSARGVPGPPPPIGAAPAWAHAMTDPPVPSAAVQAAASSTGSLSPEALEYAAALIAALPRSLVHATHHPFDARAVVVGLLLSSDARIRARQWARVRAADGRLAEALAGLESALSSVRAAQRLPLLEYCAASLSLLSPHQYMEFRELLAEVIGADDHVDRFEWIVRVVLRRAVEGRGSFDGRAPRATRHDAALVTSVLAYSGARDEREAIRAWLAARSANSELPMAPLATNDCTLDALDASLASLDRSGPREKRAVLAGCLAAVCADSVTTAVEAELLRAISAAMGVPMPPVRAALDE